MTVKAGDGTGPCASWNVPLNCILIAVICRFLVWLP
jgi:hypothetical protein